MRKCTGINLMIRFHAEEGKFALLCLALAASERCENWSAERIEREVHKMMDKQDKQRR